jgi:C4-type Zn-finger protein
MICPKCKQGEVKEQVSLKGFLFWKKKVVTSYCNLCSFRNEQVFEITTADKIQEENKRTAEIELNRIEKLNTKTHKKESRYNEEREYSRQDR